MIFDDNIEITITVNKYGALRSAISAAFEILVKKNLDQKITKPSRR